MKKSKYIIIGVLIFIIVGLGVFAVIKNNKINEQKSKLQEEEDLKNSIVQKKQIEREKELKDIAINYLKEIYPFMILTEDSELEESIVSYNLEKIGDLGKDLSPFHNYEVECDNEHSVVLVTITKKGIKDYDASLICNYNLKTE